MASKIIIGQNGVKTLGLFGIQGKRLCRGIPMSDCNVHRSQSALLLSLSGLLSHVPLLDCQWLLLSLRSLILEILHMQGAGKWWLALWGGLFHLTLWSHFSLWLNNTQTHTDTHRYTHTPPPPPQCPVSFIHSSLSGIQGCFHKVAATTISWWT